MMAALLSACSSDVSRFDDPFSNPFRGSSRFDNPNTGSVRQPSGRDMRRAAYEPVTTGSVSTSSLSSPGQQSMPAPSRPIIPASRPVVQGLNPAAKASGFNPGVASANYPNLAPVAQRTGSALAPAAGAASGWTSVGGTPITLGQGDTVNSLSGKYGVPASAIMAVNGLSPSSRLAPGQQLMIPAYNAVQGSGGASAAIQRPSVARMAPKAVDDVEEEVRKEAAPITSAPTRLKDMRAAAPEKVAQAAPRAASGAVRQVGTPNETDAEKRAAAKLRELKGSKPATRDDDEDDDTPAPRKAETPKNSAPSAKSEDAKLRAARAEAERAKLEAEKAKAEAVKAKAESEKAKAEMEKARTAKLAKAEAGGSKSLKAETAKAEAAKVEAEKAERQRVAAAEKLKAEKLKVEKAKAEKIARAKKVDDDDTVTTGSIPTTKLPERAPVEPKMAAKAESKAEAAETASADTFRWPAKGRVISGFGARGTGGANDGINIAVPEGTPVRAAEGGTVVHADDALKGYGKMVLVRHPNGYVSVYAHNGELNVKRGDTVKRGQVIAHSGATGNVTSPQLHFELRKGAQPVDPTTRLAD